MVIQNRTKRLLVAYAAVMWLSLAAYAYIHTTKFTIPEWIVFYVITGLLILTEKFNIQISNGQYFTLETIFIIGFSLLYPTQLVLWAGLVCAIITCIMAPRNYFLPFLSYTGIALCMLVGKSVYTLAAGPTATFSLSEWIPLLLYGVTYFVTNVLFMSIYLWIRYKRATLTQIREAFTTQFFIVYAVTIFMGVLLAVVLRSSGLTGAFLFTALVLLISYSYRDYFKMANHFKQLAITDELTGLHNHRHVQSVIDEHLQYRKPFAMLMIDIDNFKAFNEKYGHVHGDDALRKVASILEGQQIPNGEIARFSGDKFMLVFSGNDLPYAMTIAERIRHQVTTTFSRESDSFAPPLTVSIGIAQYPDMATDKTALFMMVDEALYKSKITGRNRVSIFTTVLDEIKREFPMNEADGEIYNTIKAFLAILNSKDQYTYAHTERDVVYAEALARRIGLEEERIRYLRFGAFLHDIGKVEIPYEVLTKRGSLTNDEWELMKTHAEISERIARPIAGLEPCLPIIRHHHERFDGKGYPDKIQGEDIPLEARILTVADSFDAMTTSRPYQKKRSMEAAFDELRRCAGTQFDPALIEPFIEAVREIGVLQSDDAVEAG
jgi:diguanylate cyclase (GGDEF)-like protein